MAQKSVALNVLYPRKYTHNGQEKTHWIKVGVGWMGDRGIDVKLWMLPAGADEEGNIKLILREPREDDQNERPARRNEARGQAQYGGAAASGTSAQRPQYVEDGDDVPF